MADDRPMTETLFPPTRDRAAPAGRGWALAGLRISSYLAVGLLGAAIGGFSLFANHVAGLSTPKTPPAADAIVVLTGGQSRLDAAIDLLKSGKGKRLLISGVHPSAGKDQLRKAVGGDRRLFNCCIDIDRAALDTIGNAEESAKWVRNHGYRRVLVVTNNYHMPRSLLEMNRLIGGAELVPYPVVNTNLTSGRWMVEPAALRVLVTEYAKYLLALGRSVAPVAGEPDISSMTTASTKR